MKKTLLITADFYPAHGGIAAYWQRLGEHLPRDAWQVLAPPSDAPDDFPYHVHRKKFFARGLFPAWLPLIKNLITLIRKERFEHIIVGQILPIGTVALMARRVFGISYTVSCHGMDISLPLKHPWKRMLCKKILNGADSIIVNSRFTVAQLKQYGRFAKKATIIYPCPSHTPGSLSPLANVFVGGHTLLSVGRLVERKGVDDVLRALPSVVKRYPDLEYVIIGDGPDRARLERIVEEYGMQKFVRFLGGVSSEELVRWYDRASVFILTPFSQNGDVEGFGIVYLEANAFGKAVIASRSGGVGEAVIDGVNGLLVDERNEKQIASAIIKLLGDQKLRTKLGSQGRLRVEKEFQWKVQAEKLKKVLQ